MNQNKIKREKLKRFKKVTLFEKFKKNRKKQDEQKRRSLVAVIFVHLEDDGPIVSSWLFADFLDSFQFFVFVQVDSMNRRIFPFEVINGPADVNSRSAICRLKNKNYYFFNYVSNLRKFADSDPFFFFQIPDSSLGNPISTSPILSAEQQHRSISKPTRLWRSIFLKN